MLRRDLGEVNVSNTIVKKSLVFVVLVVGALAVLGGCSTGPVEVKTAEVQNGTLEQTVYASGTVKAKQEYPLYGPTGVNVKNVEVEVGDRVDKGQTLVSFDDNDMRTQITLAQNQLNILQIQLDSYKKMKDSGGNLAAGQSTGMSLDDQIAMQEIQIKNQKLNITSLENKLKSYTLKAPVAGIVGQLLVSSGMPSPMGQPAVVIYDVSQRKVSMMLNPVDAMSVKVGQTARVYFGDQTFEAKVSFVSPVSVNNAVNLEVTLGDGTEIPIGSSVDVEIKTAEENGLIIPLSAVIYGEDGKTYVKVVEDGTVKQKAIKISAQSASEVLVETGLSQGEKVLTDHLDLAEGQKVVTR